MPTVKGVDKLVPYTPNNYPTLPGGEATYFTKELRKISQAIKTIEQLAQAGQLGVTSKAGLPATSDLPAGTAGVFKDTSGGGVYLAYNDAGVIKKVALT